MTYDITIIYKYDVKCIHDLTTWEQVTNYLKNKLDQWVIAVHIYKYSKDERCLGHTCVKMGNLFDIATSPTDKVLE